MRTLKRYGQDFDYREFEEYEVEESAPWMNHPRVDEMFYVPMDFCRLFADQTRLDLLARTEAEWICEIGTSIVEDGLREPAVMAFDETGKLRYHDGYHRMLTGELECIPVILQEARPNVRGYGRPIGSIMREMFEALFGDVPTAVKKSKARSFRPSQSDPQEGDSQEAFD